MSQGRGGEAKEYLQRALEIAEKSLGREHPEALWSRVSLALREAEKNPQMEIGPIVERARALAETKMGSTHPQLIPAFTRVGRTYMIRQDWLTAYRYLKRGSEIAEQKERYFHEGKRPSRNEFTAPHTSAIQAAFRIAKSPQPPGLPDEVFRLSQIALQTAAAKALGQMAARFGSGSGPLAKLVRERQDLLGQRTAAERRFFLQKTGATGSQDAGSELSAIEARLTAVDEQLRREFPEYANLANPEPLTIAQVQAQLRSDEVLVQFVEAPKVATLASEIFVWAIDKQRSRWASVELDGQAVDRLVRALRCGLDDGQWIASAQNPGGPSQCRQLLDLNSQAIGRHPLPFDLKKSHLLYRALFGSVEDLVKDKHILVVPSGVLGSVPFHVLVTEAPANWPKAVTHIARPAG